MRINPAALTEIRTRSGYSISALARETGISSSYLADLESGRRAGSPEVITALGGVLRCRLPSIILDPDPETVT